MGTRNEELGLVLMGIGAGLSAGTMAALSGLTLAAVAIGAAWILTPLGYGFTQGWFDETV